jgi:hypothetical protein
MTTIVFSGKIRRDIRSLAQTQSVSEAQLLQRAVALSRFVSSEQRLGRKLSVTRDAKILKDIV